MINLILGQVYPSSTFLIEDVDSSLTVYTGLILVPGFRGIKLSYTNQNIIVLYEQDVVSLIFFPDTFFSLKLYFFFRKKIRKHKEKCGRSFFRGSMETTIHCFDR